MCHTRDYCSGEMTDQAKSLATKPDNLNLNPRPTQYRRNRILQIALGHRV